MLSIQLPEYYYYYYLIESKAVKQFTETGWIKLEGLLRQ